MNQCKIPEFWERYIQQNGIYDLKSKRKLPTSVKQRDICLYTHINNQCVFGRKAEKVVYLME